MNTQEFVLAFVRISKLIELLGMYFYSIEF